MPSDLKHRWSLGHNYLAGITAGDWGRLLRENRYAVDAVYGHRAAFITGASLLNSYYRRQEHQLYDEEVKQTQIPPPLFVIGHWRSGTTHLHNLLAQDTERFAYANTYQVVNPYTFLCTERVHTRRFAWMLPDRRPMDNMALSFAAPQEDEFAPCLMTLRSLYLGISFPRREEHYLRCLSFRDAPQAEVERWKSAFTWFLRKLTFKYGRELALKSPPHTARIRLLLEMYPGARFVHIHRDPYTVFQSFRHYFDTAAWHTYLQRPDLAGVPDRIVRRYNLLYDAFFEDRDLIANGFLHEMRFEDLERDPIEVLQPAFHRQSIAEFAGQMTTATAAMLERWREHASAKQPLDVASEMMRLTYTIVARTLFGMDAGAGAGRIEQAMRVILPHCFGRLGRVFNSPDWLPTPENLRFHAALRSIDRVVYKIIEQHWRDLPSGGMGRNLLDMLMSARDEESGVGLSREQLRNETLTFLLAGHETTANALTWTFHLLSQHREIEDELREELDRVLGGKAPALDDLARLPFLKRVIRESMRLFPPVWIIERRVIADDVVDGRHLPAGSAVVVSPYALHRHPAFWDDPETFQPGRFENRPPAAYIPFGAGPRSCIGRGATSRCWRRKSSRRWWRRRFAFDRLRVTPWNFYLGSPCAPGMGCS
ncbi:MAG TPA: cytochrome P450 [Verrucomicrobiales bacterium]|nr:cytochrome P450 [Verrucomicrobiales bacterium]